MLRVHIEKFIFLHFENHIFETANWIIYVMLWSQCMDKGNIMFSIIQQSIGIGIGKEMSKLPILAKCNQTQFN